MIKSNIVLIGLASLFLSILVALLYLAVQEDKASHLRGIRQDAVAYLPANATGPIEQDEADRALALLNIPTDQEPVALAYQPYGSAKKGCIVVNGHVVGGGSENSNTVAEACREAGAKYKVNLAEYTKSEAQPSFFKTPYFENFVTASKLIPSEYSQGNPEEVLPLLDKADFPKSQRVAIVSFTNFDKQNPVNGCVLAGTMGTFKALSTSEKSACEKVITLAKQSKA